MFSRGDYEVFGKNLIVVLMLSKRGFRRCLLTCLRSPRKLALSVPSDLLGGSPLLLLAPDHLTARLAVLFLEALDCPSVPCDDRGSELVGGTNSLFPGESTPVLLCLMMVKLLMGYLIIRHVLNFIWGSPNLSKVLLRNCERRTRKYASFLLNLEKNCQWYIYLLSNMIVSLDVFPHVLWGGKYGMKVIQEIVSNVLLLFNFRLTLSHSDFAKSRTH